MATPLKDINKWPLLAAMVANLAVFYVAVQTDSIFGGAWVELAKDIGQALPACIALLFIGIANAQLSSQAKARLVFTRWHNPLPGSEAFTRYAIEDDRIDLNTLKQQHGPLPTDPKEQNILWYKLFKSVEDHPSVALVHREFLFTRDYTCLSLMMLVLLGGAGLYQIPSVNTAVGYLALLTIQLSLAGRAARNHGRRFVNTVLALKSAGR